MVDSGGAFAEYSRETNYEWLLYPNNYQIVLDAALEELNSCERNKQDRAVIERVIDAIIGIHEIQRGVSFRQAILTPSGYRFVSGMLEGRKLNVKVPLPLVR